MSWSYPIDPLDTTFDFQWPGVDHGTAATSQHVQNDASFVRAPEGAGSLASAVSEYKSNKQSWILENRGHVAANTNSDHADDGAALASAAEAQDAILAGSGNESKVRCHGQGQGTTAKSAGAARPCLLQLPPQQRPQPLIVIIPSNSSSVKDLTNAALRSAS